MSALGTDAARHWLDARSPEPPAALRTRIDVVLRACSAVSSRAHIDEAQSDEPWALAGQLGDAAIAALRAAILECDQRSSALDLLAADALFTYAMETAAEHGPDAVAAVAGELSGERVAALLHAAKPSSEQQS